MKKNIIFYICGVSGCGKTTVGKALSVETGLPFFDADGFHSAQNIAKMQRGEPLNDDDRLGWLENIRTFALEKVQQSSLIIACSALKERYRQRLMQDCATQCQWIYLEGSFELIQARLATRKKHFMPISLLQSQFDALEVPDYGLKISIDQNIEAIILLIVNG